MLFRNLGKLLVVLLMMALFSCKRDCKSEGSNEGIILKAYEPSCYMEYNGGEERFIIDSDSSFVHFFEADCLPANIDFTQNTLLGLFADGGGCSVAFKKKVEAINSEQKYQYEVKVVECGNCDMYGYSYNWVLVPKLPLNWTVDFVK